MVRKPAARFGPQWDCICQYSGHAGTHPMNQQERSLPSCHLSTTVISLAFLPPESLEYTDISDYQEKLILIFSSARELAASNIKTV